MKKLKTLIMAAYHKELKPFCAISDTNFIIKNNIAYFTSCVGAVPATYHLTQFLTKFKPSFIISLNTAGIINSNKLIKILNKIYSCFEDNDSIHTKVFYRIGEHIKFDDKKYSLFSIRISAQNMNETRSNELKVMAESSNFYVDIKKDLTLNIPMITS